MPRPTPPPEQTLAGRAARKLMMAERYERDAVRLRAESAELSRRWQEWQAARRAQAAEDARVIPLGREQRDREIVRLVESGLTYAEVAQRTGLTRQRIHQIAASYGVRSALAGASS